MGGGLAGLWERCRELARPDESLRVADVSFADKWLAVRLSDGTMGRAFAFTGAHEVYGPLDMGGFARMARLIGMPVGEAFALAQGPWGAAELGRVLAGSLAVALLNAVSVPSMRPEALAARGLALHDDFVADLVRPTDVVVSIGVGMYFERLRAEAQAGRVAEFHAVDMRPRCDLACVRVDATGVHEGPRGVSLHGTQDTAELVGRADVVLMTGCTLVNGTFFELMELPRHAREVVLFGPSGSCVFEALAERGVTCVAGAVVDDADAVARAMAEGLFGAGPREATRCFVVSAPR